MIVAGQYSFNNGAAVIAAQYPQQLEAVYAIIGTIDAEPCKSKVSREKTMRERLLFSPICLNEMFKQRFTEQGWQAQRVACEYPTDYYTEAYLSRQQALNRSQPYREMDFIKDKLGVEVQFGKYAFMVYNVCAKMTIFRNMGYIEAGIEIVPVKQFAAEMSSGVSYFEQFVWDLEQRGVADIDIPVLILGVDMDTPMQA